MSAKRSTLVVSAALAAAALALGMTPSVAGGSDHWGVSVAVGERYHGGRHHHGHVRAPTGPELYYSYHFDHVPAYPVPIFESYHRPPTVRRAVRYPSVSSPHSAWCHARYRSYRAHDNSFQPYHGGRRQCWSPYR